ncbi:MAG: response regulator [Xenococcaceae cyanobacterium MO_188.B29]|nr:response regulator [Xenococcaceae cyanobacterium MO_188.B29]
MQTCKQTNLYEYPQPTILVVEDDEDNQVYLAYALDMLHYHCLLARDGMTGLDLAKNYLPDLILLDIKMPDFSGFELIKMLKHNLLTCDIPIIAVTALVREQEIKLIFDTGFDGYLAKPYFLEDLEKIISSYILNPSIS